MRRDEVVVTVVDPAAIGCSFVVSLIFLGAVMTTFYLLYTNRHEREQQHQPQTTQVAPPTKENRQLRQSHKPRATRAALAEQE